mmetsp:Transcript_16476/g.41221  ORF Transcript_16476/g.41221 Transcript_16476/m.41221 type:complete len:88 (-) Transcript_16476:101-364(-)|eukprot:CAMPEP_0115518738 /NCGR_PEP_ID=MMETSP0271-20121206/78052_1 /TAXON_ID=71861 /ORGANISM="Scrippsiella trochoidea, Strain CCMP3099" /LENGTH=87 /DNA_ID=CAMNT_0002949681 /DNA_START=20 /DNA_END=283 /DNA_ORIENTATION=-
MPHWKAFQNTTIRGCDVSKIRTHEGYRGTINAAFAEQMKAFCEKMGWKAFAVDSTQNFVDFKDLPSSSALEDKLEYGAHTVYIYIDE